MIRVGVDIGGTFTDFAMVGLPSGRVAVHKQLTTPEDPARSVLEGIGAMAAAHGVALGEIGHVVHGTTLVTNALIERRGASVGMLVTEGFRDTFDVGQEQRYDLYDLRLRYAEPLVPRALRLEVPERISHNGAVLVALGEDAVAAAVQELAGQGVEAIAVCFLHAYANPAHEERAREIASRLCPEVHVSTSATVFPYPREFERWTTTCANAYAQPLVDAYLRRLERGLAELGFAGDLSVVNSSGGLMALSTAREFPVRLLESGPASGVLMSARLGRELAKDSLLSFDLGGTTAKGALIRAGTPFRKYAFEAAHVYKGKSGSGLQLRIPVLDMSEIGSGGGSIVAVDELGLMRVGPLSAGANPGPACYGRGGGLPTLTDANLVLGYLDPDYFLAGRMKLDPGAAEGAIRDHLAGRLDLDLLRAAWGVHEIANEDISRAFRMHATERGFDYRRSSMVAFGGGGPIHAARIARKLGVPEVIYPAGAGVMSALGMLLGAVSFEVVQARRCPVATLDEGLLASILAPLEVEASAHLARSGVPGEAIAIDRRLDMRYQGQGYEIEVRLPPNLPSCEVTRRLPELFAAAYRDVFHTVLDQPVEIIGWKVEARGPEPEFRSLGEAGAVGDALKGHARAWFPATGGLIECAVYDRYRLAPGDAVAGPCLIQERESTCLLDVGDTGRVDRHGNIVATIGGG
jgi:N-methylhydantoinase A